MNCKNNMKNLRVGWYVHISSLIMLQVVRHRHCFFVGISIITKSDFVKCLGDIDLNCLIYYQVSAV